MKIFEPQNYILPDIENEPFIDKTEIRSFLRDHSSPDIEEVRGVIAKSLGKKRLSLKEVAILINATSEQAVNEIKTAAKALKNRIYGDRIVLFAPLYIGNRCTNNCLYCGFRSSNARIVRHTLSDEEIVREVEALIASGHKRLVLVYGEHPDYDAEYIAHTVRTVYGVRKGNGRIRRVNINAAPLDVEGFRILKEAGIGTFQLFQETYDPELYKKYHLSGEKQSYEHRLTALDRAMQAGIDDVGIGALFGLGDWRVEVMGLVRHANHLEACFGVGPHTISFPRIKEASAVKSGLFSPVDDEDFIRMIAILRLAVPYAGLILTAREPGHLRDKALEFGVSQIDGGTKIAVGGYAEASKEQALNRAQFRINDDRSLAEIAAELLDSGHIPSFCTACYRKGRTGEHFMEFSVPGFIKRFCTPNAIFSLVEFLEDYGDDALKKKGYEIVQKKLNTLDPSEREKVVRKLDQLKGTGERDFFF